MFLHIGAGISVPHKNIIGIFDMDNATVSRATVDFLNGAQKDGSLVVATTNLPKAFVLTDEKVYLSRLSSSTLSSRFTLKNVR